MKILLFGVSNVGKTTIGKILANKLGYNFYDLDKEIENRLNMTPSEFVNTNDLYWRDAQRGKVIKDIVKLDENLVLSLSPISYFDSFYKCLKREDIVLIELYDTAENIFSRLIFSDNKGNVFVNEKFKNTFKKYYLEEINEDLKWYEKVNKNLGIENRIFINNVSAEKVADRIVDFLNRN